MAVRVLQDLFNDTEEVPPSEILVTIGDVLRNLSANITFPPEVSEVSNPCTMHAQIISFYCFLTVFFLSITNFSNCLIL